MVVQAGRHFLVRLEQLGGEAESFTLAQLSSSLRGCLGELFGELGLGSLATTLVLKHYCAGAAIFAVRAPRKHAPSVRAAIAAVRFVNKRPVRLSVIHAAGSKRTARRAMLSRLEQTMAALEQKPTPAQLGLCEDTVLPAMPQSLLPTPVGSAMRDALGDIRRVMRDLAAADD